MAREFDQASIRVVERGNGGESLETASQTQLCCQLVEGTRQCPYLAIGHFRSFPPRFRAILNQPSLIYPVVNPRTARMATKTASPIKKVSLAASALPRLSSSATTHPAAGGVAVGAAGHMQCTTTRN